MDRSYISVQSEDVMIPKVANEKNEDRYSLVDEKKKKSESRGGGCISSLGGPIVVSESWPLLSLESGIAPVERGL